MISTYPEINALQFSFKNTRYIGYQEVLMPANWKCSEPTLYTLVFVKGELTAADYDYFFKQAAVFNLSNPRVFSTSALEFSSVLHPAFFYALLKSKEQTTPPLVAYLNSLQPQTINIPLSKKLQAGTSLYYLQSLVFLSGVTLSAALIQNRWSQGTIESKLNRLWQAAHLLNNNDKLEITAENIRDFVLEMGAALANNPLYVLKKVKSFYAELLAQLVKNIPCQKKVMKPKKLTPQQKLRFGFVESLKKQLGSNLKAIVLYGSATNSEQFSDYDLIVVVNDLTEALQKLTGKSPTYNGIELNISIYGPRDFWNYQLASGDNLYDHGICLYGEIEVPHKSKNELLMRNFSFGFIRYRQLLGMGFYVNSITSKDDDKRNLLDYFIKIPLNIAKGIEGSTGNISTNEAIKAWAINTMNFDVEALKAASREGNHLIAVSHAIYAAQEVLKIYNKQLQVLVSEPNNKLF